MARERFFRDAARWVHREFVLARRSSGFIPAIPGTATRWPELQLQPAASLEQLEAIRSGRLDGGFVNFMPKSDSELNQLLVALQHIDLAVPKRHALTKLKKIRLRDLEDVPMVWFPQGVASPAFYDRMMRECYRGGLKSPRIVPQGWTERSRTILSLVSTGLGVGWGPLQLHGWRCPRKTCCHPTGGGFEYASAA